MPVTAQTPLVNYTASGSGTVFAYPFRILNESDLEVYVGGVQQTTGFEVLGVGDGVGGDITFTEPPLAGTAIKLQRNVERVRTTDYVEGGALRAQTLDDDLDRIVMMLQDVEAQQNEINPSYVAEFVEQEFTATASQTVFTLTGGVNYTQGGNDLEVFVNGAKQIPGVDYTESNPVSLTFTTGLNVSDAVVLRVTDLRAVDGAGTSIVVNVKDYGALGNDVADDTSAIRTAAAVSLASGARLYFPAGTYKISDDILLTKAIHTFGDGMTTSTIRQTNINKNIWTAAADVSASSFRDMTWQGAGEGTGGSGGGFAGFVGGANVSMMFDHIRITNMPYFGLYLPDSYCNAIQNCIIRRCGTVGTIAGGNADACTDSYGGGVRYGKIFFTGSACTGNSLLSTYISRCGRGVYVDGNERVVSHEFIDTKIELCYIGIDINGRDSSTTLSRFNMLGASCYFEANKYAGALMGEGTQINTYQNNTTPGTGLPGGTSTSGPDGIVFTGRYNRITDGSFRVGNNLATTNPIALNIDKTDGLNYISLARVANIGALVLTSGSGAADTTEVAFYSGSGNPDGSFNAQTGSLYLRHNGTELGNTAYLKITGDGTNTGWYPIGPQYGSTASRPTAVAVNRGLQYYDTDEGRVFVSNGAGVWRDYNGLSLISGTTAQRPSAYTGAMYFDTQISKPVWWDGAVWVDPSAGGSGVTSLTGTTNKISVSASTGAVTLTLPSLVSLGTTNVMTGAAAGSLAVDHILVDKSTPAVGFNAFFNGTNWVASRATTHGFLIRSANDGSLSVFSHGNTAAAGGTVTNSAVVVFNQSGTASTTTGTGALVVTGGVGISGSIYAGAVNNTPIGSTTRSTGAFTTLASNGATTMTAGTASTTTGTGTLVVTGGVGVSGAVNIGGSFNSAANITATGATSAIGYATGSGGAVTQITSQTTGVTLSKGAGAITLFTAVGSTTAQTFTVTNTLVAITDTVVVSQRSGANQYDVMVTAVAAGSFNITFRSTGGVASDTPIFNFAVIKAVAA